MSIETILKPAYSFVDIGGSSKKRVMEQAVKAIITKTHSESFAINIDDNIIFDALMAREKLGSTGIGHGIAIPHSMIDAEFEHIGALIKLAQPIDFDSPDEEPVDILFILLVSGEANDDHLQLLAELASRFNQAQFRQSLREATTNEALYDAFMQKAQDEKFISNDSNDENIETTSKNNTA